MTSTIGIRDDLVNAGAEWVDQPTVVDGNIVRARAPADCRCSASPCPGCSARCRAARMKAWTWESLDAAERLLLTVAGVGVQQAYRRSRTLSGLVAPHLNLSAAQLPQVDLSDAMLAGARFDRADLRKSDLRGARLTGATFFKANLSWTDARGADMRLCQLESADLTEADLGGARLVSASLRGAILVRADLTGCALTGADLEGALMESTELEGANLRIANLRGAQLPVANLRGADLEGARLEGADLRCADLAGAVLAGAFLEGALLGARETDERGEPLRSILSRRSPAPFIGREALLAARWNRVFVDGEVLSR